MSNFELITHGPKTTVLRVLGATSFLGLRDTPNSYVGEGGKILKVKLTEDGIETATAVLPSTTDDLPEGSTNLYYTDDRAKKIAIKYAIALG